MTSAPVPTLSEKLSQDQGVQEVADYFDYTVARQGSAYLLTKRYSNSNDLPDVTPEECMAGLKAIAKLMDRFNPHLPRAGYTGSPAAAVARLFGAEQWRKLGNGGLAVKELTPDQRAEVERVALHLYLQTRADAVEKQCATLENRNPADPVFRRQEVQGVNSFGYSTRSAVKNDIVFVTLSNTDRVISLPDGTVGTALCRGP